MGKARRLETEGSSLAKQIIDNKKFQNIVTNVNELFGYDQPGVASKGIAEGTDRSRLAKLGGQMQGALAFSHNRTPIASGTVALHDNNGVTSSAKSYLSLLPEGAALTDTLNNITGRKYPGQILIITNGLSGSTITLTDGAGGAGQFACPDSTNYDLPYPNSVILIDDPTFGTQTWRVIGTSPSGANKTLSNLTDPISISVPLLPDADNTQSIGSSTLTWAVGHIRRLDFDGTVTRTSGNDNFRIHRDTDGMTWQLGLEGTTEFGKWRWADKDNVDRVIWDINSTGKNFQFNFATGGFKIRQNASDTDGLLLYPPSNSFDAQDCIIHANRAFGAGEGLLFQRAGTNKMRIAEDIFMFDAINMGGNNILSTGSITASSAGKNIGTSTIKYDTVWADNLQYDTNTLVALGTFGISIAANNTGDDVFIKANDSVFVQTNSTGSLGFFGLSSSATKKTVTGSRGGNVALANLLTALANYNLIVDSTTA